MGFLSRSLMTSERRSPIFPKHLEQTPLQHPLIQDFLFEQNFGTHTFQETSDTQILRCGHQVEHRLNLLKKCDVVLSLKPTDEWQYMRKNSLLIGWFNHLQKPLYNPQNVTFLDLENVTVFAEGRTQKLLWKNAYVAGECGVKQTINLLEQQAPNSPAIAQRKKAVVLGYGNLGKGATDALLHAGFQDIVIFSKRPPSDIVDTLPGIEYRQMEQDGSTTLDVSANGFKQPLIDVISDADLIVNATKPATKDQPWTFIADAELGKLKANIAYVDPVHIAGHGVSFAETTSLANPIKHIQSKAASIWYNGCNAMPAYDSAYASSIISKALLENFDILMAVVESQQLVSR